MGTVKASSKRKPDDAPASNLKKAKKQKLDDRAALDAKSSQIRSKVAPDTIHSREAKSRHGGKRRRTDDPSEAKAVDVIPLAAKTKPGATKSSASSTRNKPHLATATHKDTSARLDSDLDEDNTVATDQAAALLAGFESSSDEDDDAKEESALENVPEVHLSAQDQQQLKAAKQRAKDEPGTIYIGHLPHGFYEPQMREYFSQFGTVTKLRMARNRKTGASKHFAFVEFDSAAVADIVARTMNKYLIYGHILDVRVVPQDQLHPNLWKNEGRRFKVIPRNKILGRWLREPKSKEVWEKRVAEEEKKRKAKAEKLKELGYDFEMPALKQVEEVVRAISAVDDTEQPKAIELASVVVEEKITMTPNETTVTIEETVAVEELEGPKESKKRKSLESKPRDDEEASKTKKQKVKGSKKHKAKLQAE